MRERPGYRNFVGKSYVLKEDLYLTSSRYSKELSLARYYPDDGFVNRILPKIVDRQNIGKTYLFRVPYRGYHPSGC